MSVIATAVRHLMSAGVTGESLIAAIADMEASLPGDPVAEKRRAYDRERKRAAKAANSTGIPPESVEYAELPPVLDKEISPRPPKEINPTPRVSDTGARAATRLPADWKPAKLNRDTVAGETVERRGQDWARRALESFTNHWRSANGPNARKRDWQATWANWVITQDGRDGSNRQIGGGSAGRVDGFTAALRQAAGH